MRALSRAKNLRDAIAEDLDNEMYDGWADEFKDELKPIKKEQQKEMTYLHGSKVFKKMSPEKFLTLTRRLRLFTNVEVFAGADDNRLLAAYVNRALTRVYSYALRHRQSGDHFDSVAVFIRNVGDTKAKEHRGLVSAKSLPERAVVSIVPIIKYASPLESILVANGFGGILYMAASELRRDNNREIAVKYDYVDGVRLGQKGGTFPRLTIGFLGNVRQRIKKPKSKR